MRKKSHGGFNYSFMAMTGSEPGINLTIAFPLVINGGGEVLVTTAPL